MSSSLNINTRIHSDVITYTFYNFHTPEENGKIASVCKHWKELAEKIAKDQLIERHVLSIQLKSAAFSLMVEGKKVEDFSPQYKEALQALQDNKETLTTKKVYKRLKKITEKQVVCLAGCFVINPQSKHMPKDIQESISGKAFGEFHEIIDKMGNYQLWGSSFSTTFLPIELFNWSLEQDGTVSGNKDKGETCFSLKGKVIELILVPGSEVARAERYRKLDIDRNKAPMTKIDNLVRESTWFGELWPTDLYVPKLDAAAVSKKKETLKIIFTNFQ